MLEYETFAPAAPWFSDSTNTLLLVPGGYGSIGPYTRSPAIYKCPADKSWIRIGGQKHPKVRGVFLNEEINRRGGGGEGWDFTFWEKTEIVNPSPSQTF